MKYENGYPMDIIHPWIASFYPVTSLGFAPLTQVLSHSLNSVGHGIIRVLYSPQYLEKVVETGWSSFSPSRINIIVINILLFTISRGN